MLATVLIILLTACKPPAPEQAATVPDPEPWRSHINDYTQGWIGNQAPVLVNFSHPVVSDAQLNTPLPGIVTLLPAQEVVAVFTATDVLELRHPEPFPPGAILALSLVPDKLQDIPAALPPLTWELRVIEQNFSVREIGLVDDETRAGDDTMQLVGMVETSDAADVKAIERMLAANQLGRELGIAWQHQDDRNHQFTVLDIRRESAESQLLIRWDGAAIDVDNRGERSVTVPAVSQFDLLSARAISEPESLVELRFSQALDGRQDLTGLVRVNGIDARAQVNGAVLRVYPANAASMESTALQGEQRVQIDASVRSSDGKTLPQSLERSVSFVSAMPAVRFADAGNILPPAARLTLPIEAVGVSAVQLRAFEIFPDNIGQYLQSGSLAHSGRGNSYDYNQRAVGRYLWQKTLQLPQLPHNTWQRFEMDVSELVAGKKGSLLRLELQILPQHSLYPCEVPVAASADENLDVSSLDFEGFEKGDPIPASLRKYYVSRGYYDWRANRNPCSESYYSPYFEHAHVSQLFLASNIGMLAKQGDDNTLHVVTTDLQTAQPLADTDIHVFNFQQQEIGSGRTDAEGILSLQLQGVAFSVRAEHGSDSNYLKVPRNTALPTNQFNTGGEIASQGIKGFIYGERDIWRPGDDIHLTFVLMDRSKSLPDNYPLTLEFFDPRGGKVDSITNTSPVNGFYAFALKTADDAPTGNWRAIVKVGDNYFDDVIKIENVVPNRLRIDLSLPEDGMHPEQLPLATTLHSQWLTGATAAKLKADVQLSMSAARTAFSGYESYVFDDKARQFTSAPQTVFEGSLDANGDATITANPAISTPPPGVLAVTFTQRVFEPGGQFSTQYRSASLYPYGIWAGIKPPAGDTRYYGSLDKEADHAIDLVTVDSHGRPVADHNLTVSLYALEWRWWWDERENNYAQYISNNTHQLRETASVTTDAEGRARWVLSGPRHQWGQYLVRVCDAENGGVSQHCSSNELYLGWGYSGNSSGNRDAATRMALTADQDNYSVGQTASIHLPEGPDRRVLVSIENSSRVLQRYWQDVTATDNSFALPVTQDMSPNVYVHVTQLQPHAGRDNDLPIRLYGILPLVVDDPATHLYPVISAPEKTRPESVLPVAVTERDGRPMTYTLALVDEGLLGITGYSTPDPHDSLYKREALGVLTWDMFDQVVGAYSAELSRLLSVGGSDTARLRDTGRERRFPPVVRFLGPFELGAGARGQHSIRLPAYMGAVRVMVVAGDGHAYGRAEHGVNVTQPLTLLTTLPRVLGPGEELDVPVNLFVSEPPFGTANVQIAADGFFAVTTATANADFSAVGEQLTHLGLKVNDRVGMAELTVRAALGNESAQEVIHIPVRSANPPTTLTQVQVIQPGATWTPDLPLHGMLGTNDTTLTVSSMPELRLEERLQYLIHYPHGCIEQTTSAAFPQLYLSLLTDLSAQQATEIENNVNAAIARLASFQTGGGGFGYWPYQNDVDPWANNYAGHFLLEARERGYAVPAVMLGKWLDYQRAHLSDFNSNSYESDAYRVYTLALAGKADTGAMNRLRERLLAGQNRAISLQLLALAYQHIGQDAASTELMTRAAQVPAGSSGWTYGSELRDDSVLLLLRHKRGLLNEAWQTAGALAGDLSSDTWYSTQSTAWALMSLAQVFGQREESTAFALQTGNAAWQSFSVTKAVHRQQHLAYQPGGVALRNDSEHPIYAALSNRGIPAAAQEQARSNGLQIQTRFTTTDGQALDIASLQSGTDFIAEVTVSNTSDRELTNIALTQVVPSGWQIRNSRLEGSAENPDIDYQDIGDDRLLSYFSLRAPRGGSSSYFWWRNNRTLPERVTIKLVLNASFAGKFYLPGWVAEPMYDGSFNATTEGQWVEVLQ